MTAPRANDRIEIVRSPIENAAIAREVRGDDDGAVATFDGCVRNHSHGRQTLYLEYEAYESMAFAKMLEIAEYLHQTYSIHRVAMIHRLGRLEIGPTRVFIPGSSPHRSAAFAASPSPIDTPKKNVPLWKKKFFANGPLWSAITLPPR